MNRKWLLATVLVVALAIVGYVVVNGLSKEPAAPSSPGARSAPTPPAMPPSAPLGPLAGIERPAGTGLLPGDVLRYRFQWSSALGDGDARPLVVFGEFRFSVLEADGDGATAALDLTELSDGSLREGVSTEAVVRLSPEGQVRKLAFLTEGDPGARNVVREILSLMQVTLPPEGAGTEWEATESDSLGICEVKYRRVSAADAPALELEREILEYRGFHPGARVIPHGRVQAAGRSRIALDPLLKENRGELVREFGRGKGRIVETRVHELVRVGCERAELDPGDRLARFGEAEAGRFWSPDAGVEAPPGAAALAGAVGRIVGDLAEAMKAEEFGNAEQSRLAIRLLKGLKESPQAAAAVADRLDAPDLTDGEAAVLTASLGAAGTPESQEVLLSVLREGRLPVGHQTLAALALVSVEEPVPEVDRVLMDLAAGGGPLASNGLLLQGTVGSRVRASDPGRAAEIEDRVLSALSGAGAVPDLVTALRAVGNLGPAEVPERVRALADYEEPLVRSAAAIALLRIPAPEADGLLLRLARSDPDVEVRMTALDILVRRYREEFGDPANLGTSLPDLLQGIAEGDEPEPLKEQAARLLEDWESFRRWREAQGEDGK